MLDKFKEYLELNYHKKETKDTYLRQIKFFYNYCNGDINQENVNKYFLHRNKENITESTHNLILSSLKIFLRFIDVSLELPKFKRTNRNMKDYIDYDLLNNEIIRNVSYMFVNYKEIELLLETMFFTGLRPSEMVNLKKENLDFEKHRVTVKNTKGKVDRFIPFLNKSLEEKLKTWTILSSSDQKVFSYRNRMSLNGIFLRIKKENNLPFVFTPKTMRISFAKYCLQKGLDITIIQKLLGHKDIETTMIYAEPDEKIIDKACEGIKI
jgi:integrase/recombinase XerD